MRRLTWLVGPPGAGKSTYARNVSGGVRVVEFTAMLGPLVDPLRVRRGVLTANAHLVAAVRAVELHPDNAALPPILVVAGLVSEDALFPLSAVEEVVLLLPERARWEAQLQARPARGGSSAQYDDLAYSQQWYGRFEEWVERGLPLRRAEIPFDASLLGRVVT